MNKFLGLATASLLLSGLSGYVHAITVDFDFTGECDDCAFVGDTTDVGFDPLNDGLTQTVSGRLSIDGLSVDSDGMIDYTGAGSVSFTYNGSSLINPFTMGGPYVFSQGLLATGVVADGFEFRYSSTQNLADPANPVSFDFPNFCTDLGQLVIDFGCQNIGDITFRLKSTGDWSISGTQASDIGGSGQFSVSAVPIPAAAWLFGSGLVGLIGLARRKKA